MSTWTLQKTPIEWSETWTYLTTAALALGVNAADIHRKMTEIAKIRGGRSPRCGQRTVQRLWDRMPMA
jgi:hypothetical protein